MSEAVDRSDEPLFHVVLHEPEIPQNTGNVGRTCVAIRAKLWLIEPLGFFVDDKHLRRAGMDYWQHLDWEVVDSWETILQRLPGRGIWCLSKKASRLVWSAEFQQGDILVFGKESQGLPKEFLSQYANRTLKLPMHSEVRSLNLASTVNTICYEAVRQLGGLGPID